MPAAGPRHLIAAVILALGALTGCARGGNLPAAAFPRLAITAYAPVTVQGRGFSPGERIVLRAQPREAGLRPVYARVRATAGGTFAARLRGYGLDRCTGFSVTATGSQGSRTSAASPPSGCPPVPVPSG